ncbi:hypothetical protein SAY86_003844 [Trapa natans]|uniref:Uncharacterized protein n=1 Tax=Trapa natans TaxID=22666 RepID=A0AAN7MEW2_TRANT|nr:hypothetical protein SAY86_003844 [Trapa natans]
MQGRYCNLRNMGTSHPSILGFLCSFFILSEHAACVNLALRYSAIATMHEDHKASKACPEKEAKDASAIIYLELASIATLPLSMDLPLFAKIMHRLLSSITNPTD